MENYQKLMEKEIENIEKSGKKPKLLVHSCCAPCSSYVLKLLCEIFDITVFYFNPNIFPEEEFLFRSREQQRLIKEMGKSISFAEGRYNSDEFFAAVKGLENTGEGGERCRKCFELRLAEAAKYAKENGFDYFTTTLTISPLKNAPLLNEIGEETGEKFGVKYLFSDFKKKNGYKESIALSKEYSLYRQDYCGCVFSKKERENDKRETV